MSSFSFSIPNTSGNPDPDFSLPSPTSRRPIDTPKRRRIKSPARNTTTPVRPAPRSSLAPVDKLARNTTTTPARPAPRSPLAPVDKLTLGISGLAVTTPAASTPSTVRPPALKPDLRFNPKSNPTKLPVMTANLPATGAGGSLAKIPVSVSESSTEEATTPEADESSGEDSSGSSSGPDPAELRAAGLRALEARKAKMKKDHYRLLEHRQDEDELNEIKATPIFTEAVREYAHSLAANLNDKPFSQYGLLAGDISGLTPASSDNRLFWNISAPSSFFICGSQGSGKSHTLSCLLENALAPGPATTLPRPLTGIVFHYDTFVSDTGGSPCEAAWLASNKGIKVRVLCPPTNVSTLKALYKRFPSVTVDELRLNESDLNTKRMLDLMAVTSGNMPLYLHVVNRILRDMRVEQQRTRAPFSYATFKRMMLAEQLTDMQLAPLRQRLDTLESFMVEAHAKSFDMFQRSPAKKVQQPGLVATKGTSWKPQQGLLTIVDLSCPCVTSEMACSLFNICLSLFLEQSSADVGRIIALDEAHKYMNDSPECQTLTESLLATIRLQRHLAARIIISTQEPTISPKLLDLCSVTVVHRFTSPDWLAALRKHLAGVSTAARLLEKAEKLQAARDLKRGDVETDGINALTLGDGDPGMELFSRIVALRVGEALVFAPSAIVGVQQKKAGAGGAPKEYAVKRLAHGVMKVRVRNRTTADGGRSIMS